MGFLGPRMLQCFGGPADGQVVRCGLNPEHIQVVGRLERFNLETERYGAGTLHEASYQATLLQIGQGALFSSRLVLKYVPPSKGDDDDDGA